MAAVRMWNESALGIYRFAWTSSAGTRCEVSWYDDLPAPCASFWISARGRMCDPIVIRNPERFGWHRPRNITDFRKFAQRFADAGEETEQQP